MTFFLFPPEVLGRVWDWYTIGTEDISNKHHHHVLIGIFPFLIVHVLIYMLFTFMFVVLFCLFCLHLKITIVYNNKQEQDQSGSAILGDSCLLLCSEHFPTLLTNSTILTQSTIPLNVAL